VLRVFEAMVREGDAVAYVGVLSACSRAWMLDDGLHCFDDGLLHQELTERAAGARRAAVPGPRTHPKTPKQRKGCMLMVLLKLSTSRVSATSVSDTAVPAPRGESEGESSEIQALQELWCCRTWPCRGDTRHWRRDLEEATKRYGGTRSYW
jgi:hypothetical protein